MIVLRTVTGAVLGGLLAGVAGWALAQQSPSSAAAGTDPAAAAAQPPAASSSSASPAQASSSPMAADQAPANDAKRAADTLRKAKELGYTAKVKNGNRVFCKEDMDLGSRLGHEHCVGADAINEIAENAFRQQQQMRQTLSGGGSK
jgi:hypothetical protein